jgi:hypothetical protein
MPSYGSGSGGVGVGQPGGVGGHGAGAGVAWVRIAFQPVRKVPSPS